MALQNRNGWGMGDLGYFRAGLLPFLFRLRPPKIKPFTTEGTEGHRGKSF